MVTDIAERPALGSQRYSTFLGNDGLRHRSMSRFPYLTFYRERDDRVEIVRVLHERRDIPSVID